jgi:hypothetical protein
MLVQILGYFGPPLPQHSPDDQGTAVYTKLPVGLPLESRTQMRVFGSRGLMRIFGLKRR